MSLIFKLLKIFVFLLFIEALRQCGWYRQINFKSMNNMFVSYVICTHIVNNQI